MGGIRDTGYNFLQKNHTISFIHPFISSIHPSNSMPFKSSNSNHPIQIINSNNSIQIIHVPSLQGHPWQMQLVMNAPFLPCPAPCDTGAKSAKKSLPYLLGGRGGRREGTRKKGENIERRRRRRQSTELNGILSVNDNLCG